MTLIKLPAHKAGLFISHNEHRYSGRDAMRCTQSSARPQKVRRADYSNAADDARPKAVASGSLFDGPANDSK